MRYLDTAIGLMEEDALERTEEVEPVPCGEARTVTWRFRGQVVKRDVLIVANNMPPVGGAIGG